MSDDADTPRPAHDTDTDNLSLTWENEWKWQKYSPTQATASMRLMKRQTIDGKSNVDDETGSRISPDDGADPKPGPRLDMIDVPVERS